MYYKSLQLHPPSGQGVWFLFELALLVEDGHTWVRLHPGTGIHPTVSVNQPHLKQHISLSASETSAYSGAIWEIFYEVSSDQNATYILYFREFLPRHNNFLIHLYFQIADLIESKRYLKL